MATRAIPRGSERQKRNTIKHELSRQCASGCLKSRWRILQKRLDSDIKFSVAIAVAGDDWDDNGNPDYYCRDDDNKDVVSSG